jgi:hypothetical protein
VSRWTTVEISDLWEGIASHRLLNENFEILAGLEPAVSARAPDVRWAKPGIEEPL